MAHVGEQTGTLGRVFQRLESHYRRQVQAQRIFLGAIAWPMIELAFAIFVIGLLIWILGIIAQRNNGQPIDILGFGLVGTRGLIIYSEFHHRRRPVHRRRRRGRATRHALDAAAAAGHHATARHRHCAAEDRARPPGLGTALALNVEMDLRRVVPLVLRATGNDYYIPPHGPNRRRRRRRRPAARRVWPQRRVSSRFPRRPRRRRRERPDRRIDGPALQPLRRRSRNGRRRRSP